MANNKSKFTEKAAAVFAAHPELSEVHITSDGTAFPMLCNAKNHAKTLRGKTVESYRKSKTEPFAEILKLEDGSVVTAKEN